MTRLLDLLPLGGLATLAVVGASLDAQAKRRRRDLTSLTRAQRASDALRRIL